MNIQFNPLVAKSLSLDEAILLGWIENNYHYQPITMAELTEQFGFWQEDNLWMQLAQAEGKGLLEVKQDAQGKRLLSVNNVVYLELTGIAFKQNLPSSNTVILDTNLKRHLQRFQNNDSILNKKLCQLINKNYQPMMDYAVAEGLPIETAKSSFDKFLHYVSSHPDKFWNTDLTAYWGFWVSNNKDRLKATVKGKGKRSAVESSNQHAGSNWLKKKQQSAELHTNVKITHNINSKNT